MRKYVKIAALLLCALPSTAFAQFGVVQPLHVQGNQFRDPYGNKVVLHGVMDTPNPYFNSYRWGYSCNDGSVNACLNYFEKLFTAITDTKQGAYCNLFRLHLDPCWTNDPNKQSTGSETGEANISRFSSSRLEKYMRTVYWPIAQKALNHGLYVIMRPPGVCPQNLRVGDYYQQYLKTVWDIVTKNSNVLANAGTVMIELANEPVHIYNQWGQTSATAMRDYFQPVIDVIRRNGYTGIILVPGTGWQSNYVDYATYPVNDSNYGYAVHDYPGWYNTSNTSYDHGRAISSFKASVPVVSNKPIVITEVDWSPEKAGTGHYNEHGDWVTGNYGTWATASTTKWGYAYKAVLDYYDNISMTLSGTDTYIDVPTYLNSGRVVGAFGNMWEACGAACMYWYKLWAEKDYAHATPSNSNSNNSNNSGSNNSAQTDLGSSLIPAWTVGNNRPNGWACNDAGTYPASGEATLGPRVMQFTGGGDFKFGFYVRQSDASKPGFIEYGSTNGYELPLVFGNYCLTFNCVAWAGSPYLKAEVITPNGNVLASTIVQCTKSVNKNTAASTANSAFGYLSFYNITKGNYKLRFTPCADANGSAGSWLEAVVGNVNFRYMGNPLAFNKANYVNPGWKILDGGNMIETGDASSGPRIFNFPAGGQFSYGLYIRSSSTSLTDNYAEFGSRWGYELRFLPGTYTLTFNCAAWSGSPYVKCEVINANGNTVASSITRCSLNLNKNTGVSTASAPQGSVWFNVPSTGNYRLRWTPVKDAQGNAGFWDEVVIGHIKITQNSGSKAPMMNGFGDDDETTAIETVETKTINDNAFYTLQGVRVENPTRGIYIRNGKKVMIK